MFNNHLMKACLAAVFAIGLTACSSSDNDTATAPEPPTTMEPSPDEQELAALREQIADLRTQLGLDETDDIGDSIADLQSTLDSLRKQLSDQMDEASAAMALAVFGGLGGNAMTVAPTVSATYGMGPKVTGTVTPTDVAKDGTTVATPVESGMLTATDTNVAAMSGWRGAELAGSNGMTSDTAVVYAYVEQPDTEPFESVYALTAGDLTIATTAAGAAHNALVASPEFASGAGSKAHMPTITAPGGTTPTIVRFGGTFAGATGTYRCTGADCQSEVTEGGGVHLSGDGGWTFTPNTGAMAQVPDSLYQHFGWWVRNDAAGDYLIDVFHGFTGTQPTIAITTVQGTATYSGPAAGKYALNRLLGGGTPMAGHFTATATLEVDFGDESAIGTIEGTIGSFMAGGNAMPWSVALSSRTLTDIGGLDAGTADVPDNAVWTINGSSGGMVGMWDAQMHDLNDGGVPTVITGEFTTNFDTNDGHLTGAFGTTLQ